MLLLVLGAAGCGGDAETAGAGEGSGDGDDKPGALAEYEGQQVTFVVSYGAGGGYDTIARAMTPYLEEYLGAEITVENVDGAGGLVAANSLFTEKADGFTFGFFSGQGMAGAVLGGAEGVKFDIREWSYIARAAEDPRVLMSGAQSEFKTIEDVQAAEKFTFASSGPGGSEHLDASVLFPALDIKGEIITGYAGSAETELAVVSGRTDATSGTWGSRLPPIEAGDAVPVLTIAAERSDHASDVPALLELEMNDEQRQLAEAHIQMQRMGRMLLAPPDVPEERLQVLRDALEHVLNNEEFLAEMKKIDQPIVHLGGPELKKVAGEVLEAPDSYVQLLKEAYDGG